jgi:hypothetical protein
MKFEWFHLMPYPDLPADFQEKYHPVWVDVPAELYDPVRGHAIYGVPPAILRDKYYEGVRLILRAWGEKEPFARGITASRVEVLEGAGHMVTYEQLDRCCELASDF